MVETIPSGKIKVKANMRNVEKNLVAKNQLFVGENTFFGGRMARRFEPYFFRGVTSLVMAGESMGRGSEGDRRMGRGRAAESVRILLLDCFFISARLSGGSDVGEGAVDEMTYKRVRRSFGWMSRRIAHPDSWKAPRCR